MNPAWTPYLMVGFAVVMIVGVLWMLVASGKRASANLSQLALALGLQVETKPPVLGLIPRTPEVKGCWRGRRTAVFAFTTGSGKAAVHWCAVSVAPQSDGGLIFSLRQQGLRTRILELFGAREIQLGDPEFDRTWFIQANEPEFFRAALVQELRDRITALAREPGAVDVQFQLEGGVARYAERGDFFTTRICERIVRAAEVTGDLAGLAEVFAGQKQ